MPRDVPQIRVLTPEWLRGHAARCREAARLTSSPEVARTLTEYAERLDADAAYHEIGTPRQ